MIIKEIKVNDIMPNTNFIKKKRTILILVILIFTTVLASCGNQGVQPENNADAETQLANPWTDWESLAEAEATVGFSFGLPETISSSYKAESFRTMNDELIEVTYRDDDYEVVVRKAKSHSKLGEDISGDYNNYEKVEQRNRFGANTVHYYNENDAMKTLITYEGYSWSLVAPKGYWGDSSSDFFAAILGSHIQIDEDIVSEIKVSTRMTDQPKEIVLDESQYKEILEKVELYKISKSDVEIGDEWQYRILIMSEMMESDMELLFMDDKVCIVKGDWVQTYTVDGYDKWDFFYLF